MCDQIIKPYQLIKGHAQDEKVDQESFSEHNSSMHSKKTKLKIQEWNFYFISLF